MSDVQCCSRCKNEKPLEDFSRRAASANGRFHRCRKCDSEYQRSRHKEDPSRKQAHHRKHKYGLSPEEFGALLLAAAGKCGACFRDCDKLVVDHCHTTGAVRGLICGPCNLAIGHCADDPERLRAAADYLERSQRA